MVNVKESMSEAAKEMAERMSKGLVISQPRQAGKAAFQRALENMAALRGESTDRAAEAVRRLADQAN
jgi:hypothetical protein